jgi:hypothetical protein
MYTVKESTPKGFVTLLQTDSFAEARRWCEQARDKHVYLYDQWGDSRLYCNGTPLALCQGTKK